MAETRKSVESIITVKTHDKLRKVTEEEFRSNPAQFLKDADAGIQTAVVAADGKTVRTVIGLNGFRYLPDPNPDPLDELMLLALDAPKEDSKQ